MAPSGSARNSTTVPVFVDTNVAVYALATGCDTLYSEDMQDGQVFEDRLTVRNPFAAQP